MTIQNYVLLKCASMCPLWPYYTYKVIGHQHQNSMKLLLFHNYGVLTNDLKGEKS